MFVLASKLLVFLESYIYYRLGYSLSRRQEEEHGAMKGSHGSCSHSYCSAARRQENQETGDRDQMSRRDQRSKL